MSYPSLSSLSICELSLDMTLSTPLPSSLVHERLPLRMVPHKSDVLCASLIGVSSVCNS
ncbi:hypothetical protein K443DRAFT_99756 [Laccaria amethystina LaAM-08-1]|uniref:Uncharacterized protein n=1 Tax=Laccaria amethystina LaAM-08-1 TaxID=1095629 RepID=A0A0C9WQW3_9AGAR|nr:hypothetical protein K443DRAFT_99756 [Laccaria amethystina LaAM-08-1]